MAAARGGALVVVRGRENRPHGEGEQRTCRRVVVTPEDAPLNIGAMLNRPYAAGKRVLDIQTKLHSWATADRDRRFDDLFNLVADPAFMATAWTRVRENKGSRTAGIDKRTARAIEASVDGVEGFLEDLRAQLKARTFRPLPVLQRKIPKASGKLRSLGIPTVADRVVQACLKLVLEPILEVDFSPLSHGFRPRHRAQDAVEDIRFYAHRGYEWVFEGDIAACFDEIDHTALMDQLRRRIGDKRVLALVKAFLKSGLLDENGIERRTISGTPQGGILSPLLANLALTHLDDHFQAKWDALGNQSARRRYQQRGGATYRLIRYADDFVIMVRGTKDQAESLWDEVEHVLTGIGLRLAPEKTQVVHIDEGFDFLGFRIQRHRQWGSDRRYIYSYPSKKSVGNVRRKIKMATARQTVIQPASTLFRWLNAIARGWALYFRHGASKTAFQDLQNYLWWRVWIWLRKKHPNRGLKWIKRHYHPQGWIPRSDGVELYQPTTMTITRHPYRGGRIPTPWAPTTRPALA
jgi:RNA-directed DNA polymerase